ncbi:MAG TPA: FHA domain-containing protein, partial [Candidatus Binataceae bacterium]
MNLSINRRELTYKSLAGLAGGALGWLPVEVSSHGHSLTDVMSSREAVFYEILSYISMMILSGLIGGLIVASERQTLQIDRRAKADFLRGFLICAALALFANWFSNVVFTSILTSGGWGVGHPGSMFYLVLGRVISWTLMGAILGAGVGISTLALPNVLKGAAGGWVGGFLGGLSFDLINMITGGGLLSRLVGLSLIGLAIGLFIGLVQELTKAAWFSVEQGRLRGRQYRVEAARATIGRAEENPIGLFGDTSVQQRHAVIERSGVDYVLKNLAVQDGTFVNGNRIESVDLHDGDRIGIGGYELVFHLRQTSAAARNQATLAADRPSQTHVATRLAGSRAEVTGPYLIDENGQRFSVRQSASTRLGRALDNDIVVSHASVSRHHASIESANGAFELKDLNSQN